jgi:hypothetical protein
MGQIVYLTKQGGDAVFNTVFVGRLIAQSGTTLRGNLVVSGSITAQTLIVNTTSVYSGSTRFGTIVSDTHQFTGSIFTSGSITTIGQFNGSGAGLTGTAASLNIGGNAATITSQANSATITSTSANTGNQIVLRDGSGNFSAGTITATLTGNISGNAATVTTNANLTGNVTSVGNATTIAAGVVTNAMLAGSIANAKLTNSTISGISLGSNLATLTIGTGLSGTSYNGSGAITIANTITNNNQLTNGAGYITSAGSISGNAGSVTYLPGRTDSAAYPILWGAAYTNTIGTIAYSCAAVTIQSSTGTITATTFSGALSGNATTATSAGNATTAGGLAVHTGRNNEADKIVRTQANGYILCGYINSSNGNENNNSNPDRVWGTNGSDDYLRTYRTSALSVSYASTADSATYGRYVYDSGLSGGSIGYKEPAALHVKYAIDSLRTVYAEIGQYVRNYIATGARNNEMTFYWVGQSGQPTWLWGSNNGTDIYVYNPSNFSVNYATTAGSATDSTKLPLSGGTLTNTSTNTILTLSGTEPHLRIAATGASNAAGIVLAPTTGYDAFVGNFNGGELVLYASSSAAVYINSNSIRVNKYRFNGNGALSGNGLVEIVDMANVGMATQAFSYHWYNNDAQVRLMELNSSGETYNVTGVYGTIYSDRRLKENIAPATPKLDDIMKLNVVNFNLIGNENKHIGFIAQEMQEIFPSFVHQSDTRKYDEDGNVVSGLEDALGVKIGMEFAILVKAIQEQQSQITQQNELITSLQSRLTAAEL